MMPNYGSAKDTRVTENGATADQSETGNSNILGHFFRFAAFFR
jgi:hypothetical protein